MARRRHHRFVYLIGPVDGCHKIGRSISPKSRLEGLQLPGSPSVICTIDGNSSWLELYLHRAFDHRRTNGEWFRLTDEEVALIASVSMASRPRDLPAAIVALYRQNLPPRRKTRRDLRPVKLSRKSVIALEVLAIEENTEPHEVFSKYFGGKVMNLCRRAYARRKQNEDAKRQPDLFGDAAGA